MLKNALRASRGQVVPSVALWEEHAALGAKIEAARRDQQEFEATSGEAILEAVAEQGVASVSARRNARRELRDRLEDIQDLQRAMAAVAAKAKAAEEREKKAADAAAWAHVEALLKKRAAAASKMDRAAVELATLYAEIQGIERQVFEVMPRDQRPTQAPRAGWDAELGRGIALRLKLLQPAFDGLANGCPLYVPRDWPTISALAEIAHKAVVSGRKQQGEKKP